MRAKDIKMTAIVDSENREILITGAIDTNGITINAKGELPESGVWRVIKSETNLTDGVWKAWQVSFGDGISLNSFCESDFICRQFDSVKIDKDNNRVIFYGGEVRPGEPILKIFKVDLVNGN